MNKGRRKGFFIEEDEISGKAYDSRLVRRMIKYLKPYTLQVVLAVILLLSQAATRLAGPYLTKVAIDKYVLKGDMQGLLYITIVFLAIVIVQCIVTFFHTYMMQWIGQNVMYDLRKQLFTHIQYLSLRFFDRNPVGRLMTRVTNDVEALNQILTSGVVAIFGDIFTLLGIIVVMLSLNWKLALVTFCVLPVLVYATFMFRKRVRDSFRKIRKRIARINAYLQENISGMYIVQLFSREDKNYRRFDQLNRDHLHAYLETIFYFAIFFPTVEFIGFLAIGIAIGYGGWHFQSAGITLGVLIAFIQYAQRFFRPISDLAEKYNIFQGAMAASERIFKILDEELETTSDKRTIELPIFQNKIEFQNVWFAYHGEDYVLKDINFEIKKGQMIALVGATGSGKTSIVNLLARFYDVNSGRILIDGVDIRKLPLENLRKRLAIVQQNIFMFSGSVGDNICLWKDCPSERIKEAAQSIAADEFIEQLPEQYETDVKERGSSISMGQRQLLAFVRALIDDPEILILDEATASIDSYTEELIQKALKKLFKNRTAMIIAHRLSTIKNADLILVIHKGRIREIGKHEELLQRDGIYKKLYQVQIEDHLQKIKGKQGSFTTDVTK